MFKQVQDTKHKMVKISNKILYLSFHNSLKKVYGVGRIITRKELHTKLGRQYLVPKNLRLVACKELEKMGLIKNVRKNEFEILDSEVNLEEDVNKFYQKIRLF